MPPNGWVVAVVEIPRQRRDWSPLREAAEAAAEQLRTGPKEWPGRPSRQRLDLFLAASPDTVLALLDEIETLRAMEAGPDGSTH